MTSTRTQQSAEPFVPDSRRLAALRQAAVGCQGCDLFERATQTVFGAGREHAQLFLVGEQPGDQEDLQGQPFVGPAGRVLQRALTEVGIDQQATYVTNAVKHFSFEPKGKRRIHKTPSLTELVACRPWLTAELEAVGPEVVVCMGATATRAVLGTGVTVTKDRGRLIEAPEGAAYEVALITTHPSAVLRSTDREATYQGLVSDLRVAVSALG